MQYSINSRTEETSGLQGLVIIMKSYFCEGNRWTIFLKCAGFAARQFNNLDLYPNVVAEIVYLLSLSPRP